jgi:hypothetical protein
MFIFVIFHSVPIERPSIRTREIPRANKCMQPVMRRFRSQGRASGFRRWLCPHERAAGNYHLYMKIVGRFVISLFELLIQRVEKCEFIAPPLKHFGELPIIQKGQIPEFPLRRAPHLWLPPVEACTKITNKCLITAS